MQRPAISKPVGTAGWLAVFAGAVAVGCVWCWRKVFPVRRTAEELRAAEKARQREIRRSLRGLGKEEPYGAAATAATPAPLSSASAARAT